MVLFFLFFFLADLKGPYGSAARQCHDSHLKHDLPSSILFNTGFGDMAVSNSIGSNVFDILVCLGLPWLIETAAVNSGGVVKISSEGLTYSAITLLSTVVFLLIAMIFTKWKLTKAFGVTCLVAYVIVITFSVLYELNIFGDFVLDICPR